MTILDGEVLHGDHVGIDGGKGGALRFEVLSRAAIPLEGAVVGKA